MSTNEYDILYEKLSENRITARELKTLNYLAYGVTYVHSNDQGTLREYYE